MTSNLYSDELLSEFTNFLIELSTKRVLLLRDFIDKTVSYKTLGMFTEINKKYHFFETQRINFVDNFTILPEGREAAIIGVKQYILNIENESEKHKNKEQLELDLAKSNIEANELNKKNAKYNKTSTLINIAIGLLNLILLLTQLIIPLLCKLLN
jgi:hypothetical protein